MKHLLVCIGCMLALTVVAQAAPSLARQYETVAWQEYPDLTLHSQPALLNQLFPDYDPAALVAASYTEYELANRRRAGLITCESRQAVSLAVVFYGGDGLSRLVLYSLPLQPGDATTISLEFPLEAETGLTRLLVWREAPDSGWLELLARNPNWIAEPVPGVLYQKWYERGGDLAYTLPWIDQFRPTIERPLYRSAFDWPSCAAQPTVAGTVLGKDCRVDFDGRTAFSFDEYGAFGQWVLDWSSELELEFSLPVGFIGSRAELVIYGGPDPLYQILTQPTVEVTVNGWPLSSLEALEGIGSGMQPYTFEVSHYLSGGMNRIQISTGTMSSELLIDGLELWMY